MRIEEPCNYITLLSHSLFCGWRGLWLVMLLISHPGPLHMMNSLWQVYAKNKVTRSSSLRLSLHVNVPPVSLHCCCFVQSFFLLVMYGLFSWPLYVMLSSRPVLSSFELISSHLGACDRLVRSQCPQHSFQLRLDIPFLRLAPKQKGTGSWICRSGGEETSPPGLIKGRIKPC